MQQFEHRTIQLNWNVYCVAAAAVMVVVYVVHTHARTHIYGYTHAFIKKVKLITHTLYNFAFFYDCASDSVRIERVQTQIAHAYLIK